VVKAINWPAQFRDEVIGESEEGLRAAFRLGRLYYDNRYWVEGEEVYVRVGHKIIRKAVITGDLKCCPIKSLDAEDYAAQKQSLKSTADVVRFLAETYDQPVTQDTEITIVYYKNLPLDPEIMEIQDDPHMMV
jgi:hypothetical protein